MNSLARQTYRPNRAVATAVPYPAGFGDALLMRERLAAIRDTLIVLGLQIVFRATMFFRHLNY